MLNWYALHCRSNSEEQIARHLKSCDVESFYPHRIVPSAHAKRQTVLKFFPGYLFSRFELSEHVYHPAIIRIITDGVEPSPIPDEQIASIRLMVTSPAPLSASSAIHEGDKFRVRFGPLTGVEGYVVRFPKNQFKLIVCIEIMGRSLCTPIDAASIELITPKALKAA